LFDSRQKSSIDVIRVRPSAGHGTGGVAFLTSTQDYDIRADDGSTGEQLWQDRLRAGGQSTPMTYAVDGQQFVVTSAGGHASFGTKLGDHVIAYSLPR
jgi:quinoprotein glucose dehydrogenase